MVDQGDFLGPFADPFPLNPAEVAGRLQREVRSFFKEISYGSLIIDLRFVGQERGQQNEQKYPAKKYLTLSNGTDFEYYDKLC